MLVLRTHNVQDIVITLLAPAGEWVTGENRFVIEFDSAPRKRLIDAGLPTVTSGCQEPDLDQSRPRLDSIAATSPDATSERSRSRVQATGT